MNRETVYIQLKKQRDNMSLIRDGLKSAIFTINKLMKESLEFEIEIREEKGIIIDEIVGPSGECVLGKKDLPLLIAHTDGACSGNPGPGGWAFTTEGNVNFEGSGCEQETTNNRMELMAIIKVLQATPAHQPIKVFTDSELTANCAMRNWKRKPNTLLWSAYDDALKDRIVEVEWEERDSTVGNRRANKLAQDEAQKLKDTL